MTKLLIFAPAAWASTSQPNDDTAIAIAVVAIAGVLYFLPAIWAKLRHHHNAPAIFVLNLFLGWTLLGWVVALVWANLRPTPPETRIREVYLGEGGPVPPVRKDHWDRISK